MVDVDVDSGLKDLDEGCELLSEDVSVKLSVPLVLVLSVLELPDGELGKDTEDSLVVVVIQAANWQAESHLMTVVAL